MLIYCTKHSYTAIVTAQWLAPTQHTVITNHSHCLVVIATWLCTLLAAVRYFAGKPFSISVLMLQFCFWNIWLIIWHKNTIIRHVFIFRFALIKTYNTKRKVLAVTIMLLWQVTSNINKHFHSCVCVNSKLQLPRAEQENTCLIKQIKY